MAIARGASILPFIAAGEFSTAEARMLKNLIPFLQHFDKLNVVRTCSQQVRHTPVSDLAKPPKIRLILAIFNAITWPMSDSIPHPSPAFLGV
jgi:hypothetical protein